jgi:hypothetical protein
MARRDYASKKSHTYKAPRRHIRRDKLKKEIIKKRLKIFFYTIALLGFLLSVVYWVFFSPLFLIDRIEVKGGKGEGHQQLFALAQKKLEQKIWYLLPQKNYFVFQVDQFARELKNQEVNPPVFAINVNKIWPDKLLLSFKKRIPRLKIITIIKEQTAIADDEDQNRETNIKTSQRDYLVDDKGFVIDNTPLDWDKKGPVVHLALQDSRNFKKGETLLNQGTVNNLIKLYNVFTDINTDLSIKYLSLAQQETNVVKLYVDQDYYIYFSFDYPLQKQIDNLILSLHKIGDQQNKLKYLDLRIENRVYACCDLSF